MSRLMFLLSLLAALTGTPLRQAEAADDLARTLAERDNGGEVATVDGGVGDDAGDTIKADASTLALDLAAVDALPAPLSLTPMLPSPLLVSLPAQLHPPPIPSHRRHALLQSFLF